MGDGGGGSVEPAGGARVIREEVYEARLRALAETLAPHQQRWERIEVLLSYRRDLVGERLRIDGMLEEADAEIVRVIRDIYEGLTVDVVRRL
jgi:hypothetical protein